MQEARHEIMVVWQQIKQVESWSNDVCAGQSCADMSMSMSMSTVWYGVELSVVTAKLPKAGLAI